QIAPVSAPLPTPRNFPFQWAGSGIHNSMVMLESAVGVSRAVTLQKANGTATVIVAAPLLAVVVNGPVTSNAAGTVPWASAVLIRLVHGVAAIGRRAPIDRATDSATPTRSIAVVFVLMLTLHICARDRLAWSGM